MWYDHERGAPAPETEKITVKTTSKPRGRSGRSGCWLQGSCPALRGTGPVLHGSLSGTAGRQASPEGVGVGGERGADRPKTPSTPVTRQRVEATDFRSGGLSHTLPCKHPASKSWTMRAGRRGVHLFVRDGARWHCKCRTAGVWPGMGGGGWAGSRGGKASL